MSCIGVATSDAAVLVLRNNHGMTLKVAPDPLEVQLHSPTPLHPKSSNKGAVFCLLMLILLRWDELRV